MNEFLQRLRERKLVQWTLTYLAGAFALLQGLDIVAQQFGWPEGLRRGVTVALAVGFFVTLTLAWYHGERGKQRVTGVELLILSLLLAIGGALLWRVSQGKHETATVSTSVPSADRSSSAASASGPPGNDKSIAVLPFENLSRDPDNAFFATGIQDQVLTQLAKIGALRVISRTSTEQYAAKPASVADIARQLGVANILEGSVQRAGDSVRITVQLIRADGDSHLWAETYDRKLDNIFGVESEVAAAIAAALNARLSGAEKQELAARPTHNTEAWEDYLRASVLFYRGEVEADIREDIRLTESAVRLDPSFASAWALLSQAHGSLYIGDIDTSAARREAAYRTLQKAMQLQPDLVEVRIAEGFYHYWVERDYDAARRIFEAVRPRAPSNATIPFALALISRRQNRWDESLMYFGEAVALDPRNVEISSQAAETAFSTRRYDIAEQYLARIRDVSPDNTRGLVEQMTLYQMRGQLDKAEAIATRVHVDATDLSGVLVLAQQKLLGRQYAAGAAMMRQFIAALPAADPPDDGPYQVKLGQFLALAGDEAGARAAYALAQTRIGAKLQVQPDNDLLLTAMALTQSALGHRDAAFAQIERAATLLPPEKDALRTAGHRLVRARIALRFGDKASAIKQLQGLTGLPSPFTYSDGPTSTSASLRLDPAWDSLRGDPRFQKLIADSEAAMKAQATTP